MGSRKRAAGRAKAVQIHGLARFWHSVGHRPCLHASATSSKKNKASHLNPSFRSNLKALGLAQGLNFLYPVFAFPLIGRQLGTAAFGTLMSAYSVALLLTIVVEYGFNFEGPRQVAPNRDKPDQIAAIYAQITATKLGIFFLLLASLYGLQALLPHPPDWLRQFCEPTMLVPILAGAALNPQWLLHGLNKLSNYIMLGALCRLLIFTLYLTIDPANPSWAIASLATPPLVAALLGQALVPRLGAALRAARQLRFADLRQQLHLGSAPFASNAITLPYVYGGPILLGITHGPVAAGLYAAAERLIRPITAILGTVFQAAYPAACTAEHPWTVAKGPLRVAYAIAVPAALCMLLGSSQILSLVYGPSFAAGAATLALMTLPLLVAPASMASAQLWLIARSRGKLCVIAYTASTSFYLVTAPFLARHFAATGAALALALTEMLALTLLILLIRRYAGTTAAAID